MKKRLNGRQASHSIPFSPTSLIYSIKQAFYATDFSMTKPIYNLIPMKCTQTTEKMTVVGSMYMVIKRGIYVVLFLYTRVDFMIHVALMFN